MQHRRQLLKNKPSDIIVREACHENLVFLRIQYSGLERALQNKNNNEARLINT